MAKDKFKDLPVETRRQVLESHRTALLADLFSAELYLERLPSGSDASVTEASIARLNEALVKAEERLAALKD